MTSEGKVHKFRTIEIEGVETNFPMVHIEFNFFGRVRILIKNRLKVKFDRFTIEKMSNFTFNRVLMSIRTRPLSLS
jgi:hypothetical protein